MISAAHVYGKRIIAAEAFIASRVKLKAHPASLKALGDWALCAGINRLVFHRYAMQPLNDRMVVRKSTGPAPGQRVKGSGRAPRCEGLMRLAVVY